MMKPSHRSTKSKRLNNHHHHHHHHHQRHQVNGSNSSTAREDDSDIFVDVQVRAGRPTTNKSNTMKPSSLRSIPSSFRERGKRRTHRRAGKQLNGQSQHSQHHPQQQRPLHHRQRRRSRRSLKGNKNGKTHTIRVFTNMHIKHNLPIRKVMKSLKKSLTKLLKQHPEEDLNPSPTSTSPPVKRRPSSWRGSRSNQNFEEVIDRGYESDYVRGDDDGIRVRGFDSSSFLEDDNISYHEDLDDDLDDKDSRSIDESYDQDDESYDSDSDLDSSDDDDEDYDNFDNEVTYEDDGGGFYLHLPPEVPVSVLSGSRGSHYRNILESRLQEEVASHLLGQHYRAPLKEEGVQFDIYLEDQSHVSALSLRSRDAAAKRLAQKQSVPPTVEVKDPAIKKSPKIPPKTRPKRTIPEKKPSNATVGVSTFNHSTTPSYSHVKKHKSLGGVAPLLSKNNYVSTTAPPAVADKGGLRDGNSWHSRVSKNRNVNPQTTSKSEKFSSKPLDRTSLKSADRYSLKSGDKNSLKSGGGSGDRPSVLRNTDRNSLSHTGSWHSRSSKGAASYANGSHGSKSSGHASKTGAAGGINITTTTTTTTTTIPMDRTNAMGRRTRSSSSNSRNERSYRGGGGQLPQTTHPSYRVRQTRRHKSNESLLLDAFESHFNNLMGGRDKADKFLDIMDKFPSKMKRSIR